jgi:Ca-activated chloride channel homolog
MSDEWGLLAGRYGLISGIAGLGILICLFYGIALRRARLRLIGSPPHRWRVLLQDSLVGLAALLCCLIPLRPYWGREELRTEVLSQEILIVLDVSASMAVDDLKPSRLAHARRTLDLFLTKLNASTAVKVGLVLFSGTSYVYCPLTPDLTAVKLFLDNASFELISAPGSALSEAIETASGAFSQETNVPRTVVIVTDGEEGQFSVEDAAQQLRDRVTHVVLYGVGTTRGGPIQDEQGRFLKDRSGKIVISALQESNLKNLAARVKGEYILARRVVIDAENLARSLPQPVASSGNSQTTITTHHHREVGPVFALLALILLIAASFLSPEPIVAVFLGLLLVSKPAAAQVEKLPEGYAAYQMGDFAKARSIFDQAHKEQPNDPTIIRALASAHYKLKEFAVAEELFAKARDAADSSAESFMSSYNQGNAAFEKQDYKGSRSAYQAALRIDPKNRAAQHNLRLAEKRLEEQRSNQPSKQEQNSEASSREEQKENSQQQDRSEEDQNQQRDQGKPLKHNSEARREGQTAQEQNKEIETQKTPQDEQSVDSESPQDQSKEQAEKKFHELDKDGISSPKKESTGQQRLSDEAAEAWLRSLPNQAILRKKRDRTSLPREGQTW